MMRLDGDFKILGSNGTPLVVVDVWRRRLSYRVAVCRRDGSSFAEYRFWRWQRADAYQWARKVFEETADALRAVGGT